jgi:hypothetical protein
MTSRAGIPSGTQLGSIRRRLAPLRNLHGFVFDQLPLIVCRVAIPLGIVGLAHSSVEPCGSFVRVDAPLA